MRSIRVFALITALALVAIAQRAQNNTDEALKARNAPDVFVYKASAVGSDGQHNSSFTIEVGNTGMKEISTIEWEYSSPDAVAGFENPLTFRSTGVKLRPKEKKNLTKEVRYYSTRFVSSFNLSTVRIMRVEYEDGSSWQRPANDK